MKKYLFLTTIAIITIVVSCKKSSSSSTVDCANVTAKFSTDALPVITSKCATNSGCHASGATNSGGVLTNYSQVSARKSNVRSSILDGSMPRGSSLSTAEKQAIVCWIDNGALNN